MKHRLGDMTFREFEALLPNNPVILLPLGSIEEHGPASPMGDYMLTNTLAAKIAERAGAVAAPTLPFGYAEYFRPIPGGVQLRAATFCQVLRDVRRQFSQPQPHPPGDPQRTQRQRAADRPGGPDKIRADTGIVVPSVNLWRLQTPTVWQDAYGLPGNQGFGHGAEPVASVYRHLFPDLVRPDLVEPARTIKRFSASRQRVSPASALPASTSPCRSTSPTSPTTASPVATPHSPPRRPARRSPATSSKRSPPSSSHSATPRGAI